MKKRMLFNFKKGKFPLTWMGLVYAIIFVSPIGAGVLAALQGNWDSVGLACASLVLFVIPFIAEKTLKIYIPAFFSLVISAFIYATVILGQVEHYYQKFWWWDVMLHSGSGVAFGLIGLVVILIFFREGRIAAKPLVLCLFSFCFALSVGLLWEVFEFSGDQLLHTNMQQTQTGVVDTMKDEIMDAIGALIGSAIAYLYLRNDILDPIEKAIDETIRKNRKKS